MAEPEFTLPDRVGHYLIRGLCPEWPLTEGAISVTLGPPASPAELAAAVGRLEGGGRSRLIHTLQDVELQYPAPGDTYWVLLGLRRYDHLEVVTDRWTLRLEALVSAWLRALQQHQGLKFVVSIRLLCEGGAEAVVQVSRLDRGSATR